MSIIAKLNHLRVAPRKVRLVADLIRGKSTEEAQTILNFVVKKSVGPLLKLLNQAIANAQNNFQLAVNNLYISKITVDEGPKLKRWRPRARGQTYEIQKKTSHITIVLEERVLGERVKTEAKTATKKVSAVKEVKDRSLAGRVKFKPEKKIEEKKPKTERGIKRIFKRKAF